LLLLSDPAPGQFGWLSPPGIGAGIFRKGKAAVADGIRLQVLGVGQKCLLEKVRKNRGNIKD
jgi:hypothetical protein